MVSPRFRFAAAVLGSVDPVGLAGFYADLLGWEPVQKEGDWVVISPPGGGTCLAFQLEPGHVPPTWPSAPGSQQVQSHLDIGVDDLVTGEARALALGASKAGHQPHAEVRVLLDPAGHPFCLYTDRGLVP